MSLLRELNRLKALRPLDDALAHSLRRLDPDTHDDVLAAAALASAKVVVLSTIPVSLFKLLLMNSVELLCSSTAPAVWTLVLMMVSTASLIRSSDTWPF